MSRLVTAATAPMKVRCAIYTRKSSEEGLEQEFNSLDAQREACEAYVRSQVGEGWMASPERYDDGGISGGTMERPALRRLLRDIEAGKVQIVVLYKVDRLTRSLGDFSKIVDVLDRAGASFVSVTQAFNTTTSMGRLTLNMLLSFAQFEREVTSERIRDKIAASKRKGLWMGGSAPLGYDPAGRTLKIVEAEADTVRRLFDRYLELGSVHALKAELAAQAVVSKRCTLKSGVERGGKPFSRGSLYYLLSNRLYLGEIPHKGEFHPGLHPPIVDRAVFDAVQARLAINAGEKRRAREGLSPRIRAPLLGLIKDDAGRPLSPVTTRKSDGCTYRYYASAAARQGSQDVGAVLRIPALKIEQLVLDRAARLIAGLQINEPWRQVRESLKEVRVSRRSVAMVFDRSAIDEDRINLHAVSCGLPATDELQQTDDTVSITVGATIRARAGAKVVVGPNGAPATEASTVDLVLLRALVRAEGWKRALLTGEAATLEQLAKAEGVQRAYARRMMRLAFLSPTLKLAILKGRAPAALTLQKLMTEGVPDLWADQERRAHA